MTRAAWVGVTERGSTFGMWLAVRFCQVFGGWLSEYFIVLPVVAYFFLTDRKGRRASRRYLERLHAMPGGPAALGQAPTLRASFRHYQEFGLMILDRVRFTLARGRDNGVDIVFRGREVFSDLLADKRGAILLGAHLGSFDVMRVLAARTGIVVNVLMITRHAPRINAILRRLDPGVDVRVIEPDPLAVDTVFRLRACLERGEFVAILGDRVAGSARARVVRASFLGAPAPFPQGPFLLADALGCPIIFMSAVRRGPMRYEIFAERLAERVVLPRQQRAAPLGALASAYAARLEAHCLRAPYQWFNFFDFWGER
jgi:predicted LPLAT superfamily acyltransferase